MTTSPSFFHDIKNIITALESQHFMLVKQLKAIEASPYETNLDEITDKIRQQLERMELSIKKMKALIG